MNPLTTGLLFSIGVVVVLLLFLSPFFERNDFNYLASSALLKLNQSGVLNLVNGLSNSVLSSSPDILPQSGSNCTHRFGKILLFRASFGKKSYAPSRDSVRCYAQSLGYDLADINLDNDEFARTTCAEFRDRNFQRHCVLAQYLKKTGAKYAIAMDADVAVVNSNHCIEDYIDSNASVIFYERFHTFEITACSFIVKNNEYGLEFLMDWARYSRKMPSVSWANSDNGALLFQSLLLEKRLVSSHERQLCTRLWQRANTLDVYLRYIHCAYIFLGSRRNDLSERIRILRRGHGWGRDGWTSDWTWCDHDFLMHAVKADDYNSDKSDMPSLFLQPIDLSNCKLGQSFNGSVRMKPQLHVTCGELVARLKNRLIVPQTLPVPYLDDSDLDCWPKCDKRK